jgi:hypothetical protein
MWLGFQAMERAGLEPVTPSLQVYSGCDDARRQIPTIAFIHAGSWQFVASETAWLGGRFSNRFGH